AVTEGSHPSDSLRSCVISRDFLMERYMRQRWLILLVTTILTGPFILDISASDPLCSDYPSTPDTGVTLIGKGTIPGDALDLSGLQGLICDFNGVNCQDRATFGGFGSALTYTGHDNVFLAVPDRGPFDGRTSPPDSPYLDRFHFLHITLDVGAAFPNITTTLLDTRFLQNEQSKNFVGS